MILLFVKGCVFLILLCYGVFLIVFAIGAFYSLTQTLKENK